MQSLDTFLFYGYNMHMHDDVSPVEKSSYEIGSYVNTGDLTQVLVILL